MQMVESEIPPSKAKAVALQDDMSTASTETSEHRSPGTSTPLMETQGISSWDFEKTPIAVPYGVVVHQSPTRRSHEKYVAKLEGFSAGRTFSQFSFSSPLALLPLSCLL